MLYDSASCWTIVDEPYIHQGIDARSINAQILLTAIRLENLIQPPLKCLRPTHEFNHSLHVVRYIKRVFKRRRFIRNRTPRTIPALSRVISRRIERPVAQSWCQEACEYWRSVDALNIMVPDSLPPRRAVQIFLHIARPLPSRNLAQRKVIQRILHCPRNTPLVPVLRYIAKFKPVCKRCATFFVLEFQIGKDFRVLYHGGEPIGPVDGAA
jgi:hypothetical protein